MATRMSLRYAIGVIVALGVVLFTAFAKAEILELNDSFSWIMKLSGVPKIVDFVDSKNLFFASEKNILGRINPTTGRFSWRKEIEGEIENVVYTGGNLITSIRDSRGSKVSCWYPTTGLLNWSTNFDAKIIHLSAVEAVGSPSKIVVVLDDRSIIALSMKDGSIASSMSAGIMPLEEFLPVSSEVCGSQLKLYSVTSNNLMAKVDVFDIAETSHVRTHSVDLVEGGLKPGLQTHSSGLLFNTSESGLDVVVDLSKSDSFAHGKVTALQLYKHSPPGSLLIHKVAIRTSDGILYSSECGFNHIRQEDLSPSLRGDISISFNFHHGNHIAAHAYVDEEKSLYFQLFSGSKEVTSLKLDVKDIVSHSRKIKDLYFSRPEFGDTHIFIVTDDGSTYMFDNNVLKMSTPEFLTEATSVLVIDPREVSPKLANSGVDNGNTTVLASYLTRVKKSLTDVLRLFSKPKPLILSFTEMFHKSNALGAIDPFGFSKNLLFLTKNLGLASFSSRSGKFIWRLYDKNKKFYTANFIQDPSRSHKTVLVTFSYAGFDDLRYAAQVDPTTGELFENDKTGPYLNINKVISHRILLPNSESREIVVLISEEDSTYHALNTGDIPADVLESELGKLHSFKVDENNKGIGGYKFSGGNLVPTWKINFPDNEVVACVGSVPMKGPVASIGYMTHQKGTIYKYLNPNVLAVVTLMEYGPHPNHTDFRSSLNVSLIDATSGVILHRSTYSGAGNVSKDEKTVKIIQHENWILLYFWNHGLEASNVDMSITEKRFLDRLRNKMIRREESYSPYIQTLSNRKGFELAILELYESVIPEARMQGEKYSPYIVKKPVVLTQSYAFGSAINAIGVTRTELGVTNTGILVSLPSNQILSIGKNILDAKRPIDKYNIDPSKYGNKELPVFFDKSLPKYKPLIDTDPYNFLVKGHEILGVKKIEGIQTRLESTSAILSYGTDVMYTTISPSGQFDRIGDKFNKPALVIAIFTSFVGVGIIKHVASHRKLKARWK